MKTGYTPRRWIVRSMLHGRGKWLLAHYIAEESGNREFFDWAVKWLGIGEIYRVHDSVVLNIGNHDLVPIGGLMYDWGKTQLPANPEALAGLQRPGGAAGT